MFKVGDLVDISDVEFNAQRKLYHPIAPLQANPGDWIVTDVRNQTHALIPGIEIQSLKLRNDPTFQWFLYGSNGPGTLDVSPSKVMYRVKNAIPIRMGTSTAQPVLQTNQKNDGERCIHCGRKNKEILLLNSTTRYCPVCEGVATKQPKKPIDSEWDNLLASVDSLLAGVSNNKP